MKAQKYYLSKYYFRTAPAVSSSWSFSIYAIVFKRRW